MTSGLRWRTSLLAISAPHVGRWNAAHGMPLEAIKLMGKSRPLRARGPRGYGAGVSQPLHRHRGDRKARPILGITLQAAVGLGISDRSLRYGTTESPLAADLLAGHALAAFGLTEPRAGSMPVRPLTLHYAIMNG
jgi:butyryl-CoA dehydrogenase